MLLSDADLIYLYDGSLEGLLSAVFDAFERHENPTNIIQPYGYQESLLSSPIPLTTSTSKATRVRDGIINQLGEQTYHDIKLAFLSDQQTKGGIILRFLQYAFRKGRYSSLDLANPAVGDLEQLSRQVNSEAHAIMQFARFAELNTGAFVSYISPKANVVPLVMDHFSERFNVQPFIIIDNRHKLAGLFDRRSWWLAPISTADNDTIRVNDICLPATNATEDYYQNLWQTFFDTIAIEERRNPVCQRGFMPKRFWGNMCEHVPEKLRRKQTTGVTPSKVAKANLKPADFIPKRLS